MLRCALFLTLLAACAANDWPCPQPATILPCVCTADAQYELTMDCSDVQNSKTLAQVFQTHFSFNSFKQLIINPTNPSISLQDLPAGVFGPVSFKKIDITNTRIHTVEEQALVNSHTTLEYLNIQDNKINNFSFETLKLFTALVNFNIANNKLSGTCPDIESGSLLFLNLSDNSGFTLRAETFLKAPYLEKIFLNNMRLGASVPADVFKSLKFLEELQMNHNDIPGELIENFIDPELRPLMSLTLNNNKITQLHHLAITGKSHYTTTAMHACPANNRHHYLRKPFPHSNVTKFSKL
ncbi:oplophorus-luciferin 2-monooxygenase non-catalytic subunit-like [Portunus trituberculatus]|uniref:Oplophorus-luciferin 2-monooxygenase non-catalytic subunit n=1 Tax=Portunus trituberculatus TaxID=210409 RepID=A0A5B7JUF6_PORTR|nr:oplophorus-luciferin 2-monooxygenase non-catalytic subunit-like [Portunus trituberculatus]MPC95984.1 Oplophorus-luciferin 2-monooxygenase non-catalytic subunit [Portunus trituberculatus]